MIIGVDAGALAITDERLKVGVWRVAFNLVKELSKIDKRNEYRLYSFREIDKEVMREFGQNVKNVVIRPKIGWSRIQLTLHLRFHPVDVFLGLSQFLPTGTHKGIGFIYDVNFLRDKALHPESNNRLMRNTQTVVDRAQNIITISEASKNEIKNWIPGQARNDNSRKLIVAYPGVDGIFTIKGKKYVCKHPYFLFVGSLKRGKNIPRIIRAFSEFEKKSKTKYELLIIGGDYWRDPEIDKECRSLMVDRRENIRFLGVVPDKKLAEYYRGARALVSPSIWEGFCLPAAEALACGTPVIGSTTGSMPEVVGEAGILVNPNNEREIVAAMKEMSTNEKSYRMMKAGAKAQAQKFTWRKFAEKVLQKISE